MITILKNIFIPTWLTGPVFEKELRISSRRKRTYVIKSLYVLITAIVIGFIGSFIYSEIDSASYNANYTMNMAEVGRYLTVIMTWSQFIALQILALIMLSNSISDEVNKRTLGVLMTTPITSLQIVAGKMLSKLYLIFLLLLISLPVLIIIRTFGGISWQYITTTTIITFSIVLFTGSLSLFLSILTKKTYLVIIYTIIIYGIFFLLLPIIFFSICYHYNIEEELLIYFNPYISMIFATDTFMSSYSNFSLTQSDFLLASGITSAAAIFLLIISTIMVRRVALAQMLGTDRPASKSSSKKQSKSLNKIRRIKNNPVTWMETRSAILSKKNLPRIIFSLGVIGCIVLTVALGFEEGWQSQTLHGIMGIIYMTFGILITLTIPATTITSEREAGTWLVLMATPISEYQILKGKFFGSLRKCLFAWAPYFIHYTFFTFLGLVRFDFYILLILLAFQQIVFMIGSGIFISSKVNRTTTAVVISYTVILTLWLAIPILLALYSLLAGFNSSLFESYIEIIPYCGFVTLIDSFNHSGSYNFAGSTHSFFEVFARIIIYTIAYSFIGYMLLLASRLNFRARLGK